MKYISLLVIACCCSLTGMPQDGGDRKSVEHAAQSWFNSFNNHNYDTMFDYMAEDCFGINPLGRYMTMSKEAPVIFNKAHETFLKNLSIKVDSINVRFINRDAAVATVFSQERAARYQSDGIEQGGNEVEGQGVITTMVIVKKDERWVIIQYQSTHISK